MTWEREIDFMGVLGVRVGDWNGRIRWGGGRSGEERWVEERNAVRDS